MEWLLRTFATPAWLLALPLVALAVWWVLRRRATGTWLFSDNRLLAGLPRGGAARLRRLPLLLRAGALTAVVVALARPWTFDPEELDVEGLDIVVALDMSGSMETADLTEIEAELANAGRIKPLPRFPAAVAVLRRFIESRRYDRIGMIVFGARAHTQFPLTLDYRAILGMLGRLRLGDVDGSGTVIGDALGKGLNLLRRSEARTRLLILITDGASRGGHLTPHQAAEFAATLDVKVFPILVGATGTDKTPHSIQRAGLFGLQRAWQPVEHPVDPELLQAIADKTGGTFYTAADREALETHFQEILDRCEKTRIRDLANALRTELFPWFAGAAFALLLLAAGLELTVLRKFP